MCWRKISVSEAGVLHYNHKEDSCKTAIARAKAKQHAQTSKGHVWKSMSKKNETSCATYNLSLLWTAFLFPRARLSFVFSLITILKKHTHTHTHILEKNFFFMQFHKRDLIKKFSKKIS